MEISVLRPEDGTVEAKWVRKGVGINPKARHRQRIAREYWIPRSQVGGNLNRVVRSCIAVDPKPKLAVGDRRRRMEGRNDWLNHGCREALGGTHNGRAIVRDDHGGSLRGGRLRNGRSPGEHTTAGIDGCVGRSIEQTEGQGLGRNRSEEHTSELQSRQYL